MEVKIFYIDREQREKYTVVAELLKEHVFRNLLIDEYYAYNYGYPSDDCLNMYLSLLNSSVIKYKDFNLMIQKSDRYPMYSYWHSGMYSYIYSSATMGISRDKLWRLFPAVAIMDRMIILPQDIINAFDYDKNNYSWLPKPLEAGGAILVDYSNTDLLREGICRVEKQLQYEISRLCIRHMTANNIPEPDYYALGKLLRANPEFVKKHTSKLYREISLRVEAAQDTIPVNQDSFVTINLYSKTESPVGRIRVTVSAPSKTLDYKVSEVLEMDYSGKLEFRLNPKVRPYCPLEVSVETYDLGEGSNPMQFPVILNVL